MVRKKVNKSVLTCGSTLLSGCGQKPDKKEFYDLPGKDMISADNQRYLAEAPRLFGLFLEDDLQLHVLLLEIRQNFQINTYCLQPRLFYKLASNIF